MFNFLRRKGYLKITAYKTGDEGEDLSVRLKAKNFSKDEIIETLEVTKKRLREDLEDLREKI